MAINEKIVTGRKFRRLIDKEAKLWQLISWWGKASDVEFDDGKTAEQKVGNINGITSSFQINDSSVCASSVLTNRIKTDLNDGIINDHIQFVIDEDGNLGWKKDGADTVINFSSIKGFHDKLKAFSRLSTAGNDCIYYLGGNCIPVIVFGSAHNGNNGVTFYSEWNVFRCNANGPNIRVVPIASYTTKTSNDKIVIDKIVEAQSGDTIVGWKLIGKSLSDDARGGFSCYYIDGQSNVKYDDLYNHAPSIDQDGKPYPLV